jgi:hypothetical protein
MPGTQKGPDIQGLSTWARLGSNQRPLACEASALPLSYAPFCGRFYGAGGSAIARCAGVRSPDPSATAPTGGGAACRLVWPLLGCHPMHRSPVSSSEQEPETYEPPAIVSREPIRDPVIGSVIGSAGGNCAASTN